MCLVGQQADVEAGATHVDGDAVVEAGLIHQMAAGDNAAARSRQQQGDRQLRGALGRGDAAVRLHHPQPGVVCSSR